MRNAFRHTLKREGVCTKRPLTQTNTRAEPAPVPAHERIALERAAAHLRGRPKGVQRAPRAAHPLGGQPERPSDAKTAAACLQDKQAAAVRSCPDEATQPGTAAGTHGAQRTAAALPLGSRHSGPCCRRAAMLPTTRPRFPRRLGPRTSIPNASSPRRRVS